MVPHFLAFCLTASKISARVDAEVFQPGRQICLASAEIVIMVGMDGQSQIVALQIFSIVLLQ